MMVSWQILAWEDYLYWLKTDKSKLKRINELIKFCLRTPYKGIGNPEGLKHDLQGFWSRRIDTEHRLVYTIQNNDLIVVSCRYHY